MQILSTEATFFDEAPLDIARQHPDQPLDRELVAEIRHGDDTAWRVLTRRYTPLIWSIASGYGLSRDDCADVTQNTWFRLLHSLDELRKPDSVKGFLATCARYESVNVIRHRDRSRTVDLTTDPAESASTELTAEEELTSGDPTLKQAFMKLSARCRTVLAMLSADPPASYEAVAQQCDISVNSVGSDRRRCLDQLRVLYDSGQQRDLTREVARR